MLDVHIREREMKSLDEYPRQKWAELSHMQARDVSPATTNEVALWVAPSGLKGHRFSNTYIKLWYF